MSLDLNIKKSRLTFDWIMVCLCATLFSHSPLLNKVHFESLASQTYKASYLSSWWPVLLYPFLAPNYPSQLPQTEGFKDLWLFHFKAYYLGKHSTHLALSVSLFMLFFYFKFLCVYFCQLKSSSTFLKVFCSGNILHDMYSDLLGKKWSLPFHLWVPRPFVCSLVMTVFLYSLYYSY